ncbi:MAG TPA: hypothetical protein VL135_00965 [Terracidiphilus sp.]|nr:hypothetical protein [Terracidiphilus sp.]
MKAHRLIVRALLLISLLSPLGLRAFGSRISSPSCQVLTNSARHQHQRQIARSSVDVVLAAPAHRSPAQRIHRLRGKRINLDRSFVLPPASAPIAKPPSSIITLEARTPNGPNPTRGPPFHLSL